jgi:alpha-beta hydrolase superfamily lysophospholipase
MDQLVKTTTREGSFKGRADYNIAYRSWTPASPTAVMLIVPGFNSHSAYFDWAAGQLAGIGFASFAVDLRGRGKSDGERFFVRAFDDYVSDVEGLMAVARKEYPDLPIFVLGHSAGGVVACVFALKHQDRLAGLICESFAFEVPSPDFALAVLKGISHLAPHAHVLALRNADFSRDPAAVARMDADPLIAHETQSTQTVAEMVRADERLKRDFPSFSLPLLILHGTADRATKPSGSQHFFERAGSKDKTLKLYRDHVHDLLNDLDRETVMADIAAWLEQRVG